MDSKRVGSKIDLILEPNAMPWNVMRETTLTQVYFTLLEDKLSRNEELRNIAKLTANYYRK